VWVQFDAFTDRIYFDLNASGPVYNEVDLSITVVAEDTDVITVNPRTTTQIYDGVDGAFKFNQWQHVAVSRTSGVGKIYVDGVSQPLIYGSGTTDLAGSFPTLSANPEIGERGGADVYGFLDQLRISDIGRYPSDFTPPTGRFESDPNTIFLLNFDGLPLTDEGVNGLSLTNNSVTIGYTNSGYGRDVNPGNGNAQVEKLEYAHYKLNDDAASTTVLDGGSGANNGTLTNANTEDVTTTGAGSGTDTAFELNDGGTPADDAGELIRCDGLVSDINTDTTGTFAFWLNPIAIGTTRLVFSANSTGSHPHRIQIRADDTVTLVIVGSSGTLEVAMPASSLSTGSWQHFAWVQDGVTPKAYVDGEEVAVTVVQSTQPVTSWFTASTYDVGKIGGQRTGAGAEDRYYEGSLDDFRYYQNQALSELQIKQIYNEGAGTENPLTAYSFDGTGDFLQIRDGGDDGTGFGEHFEISELSGGLGGSQAWTIDFWFLLNVDPAGSSQTLLYCQDSSEASDDYYWRCIVVNLDDIRFNIKDTGNLVNIQGDAPLQVGKWHHFAAVKVGTTWGLYIDSKQVGIEVETGQVTRDWQLNVGRRPYDNTLFLDGKMDNIQVTKANKFGVIPAQLRADMESTTANTGQALTLVSSAVISSSESKFGTNSLYIPDDGSSYAHFPDSNDWNFGTNDFTIEFWINWDTSANNAGIITQSIDSNNRWYLFKLASGAAMHFDWRDGGTTKASYTETGGSGFTASTWYHIAAVRRGSSFKIYKDGTALTLTEDVAIGSNSLNDVGATPLWIGRGVTLGDAVQGYISELKVYNGWAKYTQDFTAPTGPGEDFT
jgi:hypothetical protein